jgi:hypothetical protein
MPPNRVCRDLRRRTPGSVKSVELASMHSKEFGWSLKRKKLPTGSHHPATQFTWKRCEGGGTAAALWGRVISTEWGSHVGGRLSGLNGKYG